MFLISVVFISCIFVSLYGLNRVESRWIRFPLSVIFFLAAWLLLKFIRQSALSMGEINGLWLVLYYFSVYLFFCSVRFAFEKHPANHRVLKLYTIYGYMSCCILFLFAAAYIFLIAGTVFNADILWVAVMSMPVLLFYFGTAAKLVNRDNLISVLFLRKFGSTDLNEAVRRSISTGQGKITPRLITLDDENFAPQGTNWTPLLVGLPGSAIILVGPVLAAIWFDANAEILFGFAENSVDAENVKRAMRTFIMSIGICLLPWLTFRMLVLVWSEHAKRTSVEVESDINNITRTLMADRSEWQTFRAMHIPRSRVVTTSHQLWKSAVKQLASSCDLIVIDVSSDSESIRWEIELITEHHLSRSLVLCNSASALPEQFSSGSSVYFYSSKMQIVDIVQQAMSEKKCNNFKQ